MLEAYWYARIYEKSAAAKRISNQGGFSRNKFTTSGNNNFRPSSQKGQQTNSSRGIQKPDQKSNDQEKKKCYYCQEPWHYQHKCKIGKTVHMLQEEQEEDMDMEQETEEKIEGDFKTAPNSPEHNENQEQLMLISAHAVEGTPSPATFSLITQIGGRQEVALVDSGSTDTFMSYELALKSGCKVKSTQPRKITVAGGGELTSDAMVSPTIEFRELSSLIHSNSSNLRATISYLEQTGSMSIAPFVLT